MRRLDRVFSNLKYSITENLSDSGSLSLVKSIIVLYSFLPIIDTDIVNNNKADNLSNSRGSIFIVESILDDEDKFTRRYFSKININKFRSESPAFKLIK